ncbi:hypothetical protein [Sneathiella sp.]|uniref:hypothetical protein n=1 Tax=Sneathiella sp. TaxID=1964365 RepID=UPI0035660B59
MTEEMKRIKLNALQSKTLMLLQLLARDPDSSTAVPDSEDIRITRLPHGHGNHMHVGDFVVSTKDANGLSNKSVWTALARKGLVRENWDTDIILTPAGVAFTTGLDGRFLATSDH